MKCQKQLKKSSFTPKRDRRETQEDWMFFSKEWKSTSTQRSIPNISKFANLLILCMTGKAAGKRNVGIAEEVLITVHTLLNI